MSETTHEYMDTGALTGDAVPAEPAPVEQPPVEAPGSPSSEVVEHASPEDTDGERGPDADLPRGATITAL